MDALRFIGFALIAVMVVIGLDYYQQDKKHDGTLSVSGYLDTVNKRFDLYQAEQVAEEAEEDRQKRWRAGGKPYLPDAGQGWTRRAIVDGDYTLDARTGPKQAQASDAARPLAIQVAEQEATIRAKKLDRKSWVYENGDHTIWVHVSLVQPANTRTLAGNIAQSIAAMDFSGSDRTPLGVIGGVAFFRISQTGFYDVSAKTRTDWAMIKPAVAETTEQVSFSTYRGTLGFGQEIRLLIRSDAPHDAVYSFLRDIDYDGLNALLQTPVPTVGNTRTVEAGSEDALAVQMADLRTEFEQLQGELAQMRIQNLDGLSLVANTMATRYGLPNDALDLTANKIATPTDLIDFGYRKGLSELMKPDVQKAEADEGGGFLSGVMARFKGGDAETSEEASPGLLSSFGSFFQKTDTALVDDPKPSQPDVRVNKGGKGAVSECSTKGGFKRCSFSGG